jgi:hypothetical protein
LAVTISECTGIIDQQAEDMNVYPNPATDMLNVSFSSSFNTSVKITIFNHLGQAVYQSTDINGNISSNIKIDVSTLNAGTYTLQLINDNKIMNKVFIKTR